MMLYLGVWRHYTLGTKSSIECSVTSCFARVRKASRVWEPWSPLPRTRTLTESVADSLSPMTRMNGTFCRPKSRIFAFIFWLRAVEFDAEAGGFEALLHALCVVEVLFADGHEADLHGREPEGEGSGVVLDEDAEEALDGAEQRAVDHDGLVALAVFADVLELEALGQVEVELNGGELPQAAQHVDELDVDLGTVEGGFAGD